MSEAIAMLEAQIARLEDLVEHLEGQVEVVQETPVYPDESYDGPFYTSRSADLTTIEVHQGYAFAGDLAEYDWPQDVDTTTVDVSGYSDGDYLLLMAILVDPSYGCFTAGYVPTLQTELKSDHHKLNHPYEVEIIIAEFTVSDGKAIGIKQRWRGDIYVPVQKHEATPVEYSCRLTNVDDATESADPNAAAVEKCHAGE